MNLHHSAAAIVLAATLLALPVRAAEIAGVVKRVQGSVAEFGALINRHLIEQADFMPLRNRVLAQRRMAWIGK